MLLVFLFCAATTTTSFRFLEFDFLIQNVCAKNTWKSSATATKEIPKGEISFLQETARDYLCQELKTWSDIFGRKLKTFMAATKWFHLATASFNE